MQACLLRKDTMYYWDFEHDRFEKASKNEMRKIFQEKEGDCFDNTYNIMTFQEFYQPDERFSEIFWDMSYKLSSLHRYLEYSHRYILRYVEEGRKYGKTLKENKETAAEDVDMFCETFYSDEEYLSEYNYVSIFLMLYTIFENFMYQLVLEVGEEKKVTFESGNYKGAYVVRYLSFLNKACGMNIVFESNVWKKFGAIRRIRNVFIHNRGFVQTEGLFRSLEAEFPNIIKKNKVVLDYDFMIDAFEVMGNLLHTLEEKYWDLYLKAE